MQTSTQSNTQLLDYLVLLETLQTLENYKEFCYNLYLLATHTEVKDTNYVQTNPHYNEATYNRYFHTDALGSITAITDDTGKVIERRSYEAFGKIRAMDYGTNNNTIANTTIQTTRAFTGHEQIAELSGLIHMNARIYDSDIGRFLSADTVVQDPHDSQAYNRYSYARNNPMVFTDPSGHSWWTDFRDKWVKPIVGIVVGVLVAIYAPQFLSSYFNLATGTLGSAVATGALAGAAGGAIMTGTLSGTLKGAAFGAISAGVAYGIGEQFGHAGSIFGKNVKAGQAFIKATAHGLSRGVISMAQGGTFKSGFASGFSSSFFSPGTELGGDGAGGFTLRTTIAGVVGGTASEIGGGKFANGAVSGAFVHMFNAEQILKKLTFAKAREHYVENTGKQISVLASSVDLSKVSSSMFSNIGDSKYISLFVNGNEFNSLNDALVYGTIKIVYVGENKVGIMPDYYDFDMKDWSFSTVIRNFGTLGGRIVNMDPMGSGSGYTINFVGTATIGGN